MRIYENITNIILANETFDVFPLNYKRTHAYHHLPIYFGNDIKYDKKGKEIRFGVKTSYYNIMFIPTCNN